MVMSSTTVPSFRQVVSRNPSETEKMDSRLQMSEMTAIEEAPGFTNAKSPDPPS
jgi:hypothetical protein